MPSGAAAVHDERFTPAILAAAATSARAAVPVIAHTTPPSAYWSASSFARSCREVATVPTPTVSAAAWASNVGIALSPRTEIRWAGSDRDRQHRPRGAFEIGCDLRPGTGPGVVAEGELIGRCRRLGANRSRHRHSSEQASPERAYRPNNCSRSQERWIPPTSF